MVFDDFFKEDFLTLLPLKSTTREVDIYNFLKTTLWEKMWPLQTWCLNGAPVMSGCHIGFIANSTIIHQDICTKVMGFGHVMTPVMIIKHSSKGQTTQNCFLRKCLLSMVISSSPHKSAGQAWVICYSAFFPLKQEIKAFVESREEDTTLLSDTSVRHWVAA